MKLAVFLPNWIGDAVMATPALRALREHFAGARFVGVLKPYVAGVLEGAPWLDELVLFDSRGPWSRRWPAAAWALRREPIDMAVLFPNSFRSALVARLGGCRRRLGYVRYGRGPLLTYRLAPVRDVHGRLTPSPTLDAYNRLAQAAGCPRPSYRLELFTTPRDEAAADAVWQRARLHNYPEVVCLNPGAAFGSAKCWPAEYFARLARDLAERRGSGVLVLCGPAEREAAGQIAERAAHPAVHSLGGHPLSLGLTKACVRRCNLLVTTDSGPRHFGIAFDRPVLTLFGPTHIAWTETYHAKSLHLQKPVPCGPCQRRVCPLDHRCMKELAPGEVYAAAAELLRRHPPARQPALAGEISDTEVRNMVRVLVASLLAAAVLFVWGAVWWMFLPFAGWAMKKAPDEQAVSSALKTSLPESGAYFLPFPDQPATPEAQEAANQRHREGPLVEIVYRKDGVDAMSPSYFAVGFAHEVLSALLAAALLGLAAPALRSYAARVGFVALLGLFAAVALNLSDIIWFHHPWQFPAMMAAFNASGLLLASLVLAALIRSNRSGPSLLVPARNGAAQHATAVVHRQRRGARAWAS